MNIEQQKRLADILEQQKRLADILSKVITLVETVPEDEIERRLAILKSRLTPLAPDAASLDDSADPGENRGAGEASR